MEELLDLYTDYLITSFGQTSATGLSNLLDNSIKHDSFTRLLSKSDFDGRTLWQTVKPVVRENQSEDACLIFDDSIIEKTYTDENDLMCWHWDHSKGRSVKGINLLSAFYHTQKDVASEILRVPVDFKTVTKPIPYSDLKSKKEKRRSVVTKNELMREMIAQAIGNGLKFKYILADSWFSSVENMTYIKHKKKFFIFDMKANRSVALSEKDRDKGNWTRVDELEISDNKAVKVWLKDLSFPVLLTKEVFTNKDDSTGVRFLVTNEFSLTDDHIKTIYKKRWSVEEYHKSLKQNASVAKSPTRTVKTQSNHLYGAIVAYVKLEQLKFVNKMNHFAMKTKIYNQALKAAFKELARLKQSTCA